MKNNEKWFSTICYNSLGDLLIKIQPLLKFNLINDYELVFHKGDDDCSPHIHLRVLVDDYVDTCTFTRAIEMIEYYSNVPFKCIPFKICNAADWDMYIKEGTKTC